MTQWHQECEYYERVYEFGKEYQCCKHPDKQDSESDCWAECEKFCDYSDLISNERGGQEE